MRLDPKNVNREQMAPMVGLADHLKARLGAMSTAERHGYILGSFVAALIATDPHLLRAAMATQVIAEALEQTKDARPDHPDFQLLQVISPAVKAVQEQAKNMNASLDTMLAQEPKEHALGVEEFKGFIEADFALFRASQQGATWSLDELLTSPAIGEANPERAPEPEPEPTPEPVPTPVGGLNPWV